jgi:hypothetical protein
MLTVGNLVRRAGNITTLNAIGARPAEQVAANLGYHRQRLALGYWLLLLKGVPALGDFELDGTTLRSGGREGKPAATQAADLLRVRVHDSVMQERGSDGYSALQSFGLSGVTQDGWHRLAKVVPAADLAADFSPAREFPMGGGFLQWRLKVQKEFLVAMFCDRDGVVTTPHFTVDLAIGLPHQVYDRRARLVRYLQTAKVGA